MGNWSIQTFWYTIDSDRLLLFIDTVIEQLYKIAETIPCNPNDRATHRYPHDNTGIRKHLSVPQSDGRELVID